MILSQLAFSCILVILTIILDIFDHTLIFSILFASFKNLASTFNGNVSISNSIYFVSFTFSIFAKNKFLAFSSFNNSSELFWQWWLTLNLSRFSAEYTHFPIKHAHVFTGVTCFVHPRKSNTGLLMALPFLQIVPPMKFKSTVIECLQHQCLLKAIFRKYFFNRVFKHVTNEKRTLTMVVHLTLSIN